MSASFSKRGCREAETPGSYVDLLRDAGVSEVFSLWSAALDVATLQSAKSLGIASSDLPGISKLRHPFDNLLESLARVRGRGQERVAKHLDVELRKGSSHAAIDVVTKSRLQM